MRTARHAGRLHLLQTANNEGPTHLLHFLTTKGRIMQTPIRQPELLQHSVPKLQERTAPRPRVEQCEHNAINDRLWQSPCRLPGCAHPRRLQIQMRSSAKSSTRPCEHKAAYPESEIMPAHKGGHAWASAIDMYGSFPWSRRGHPPRANSRRCCCPTIGD